MRRITPIVLTAFLFTACTPVFALQLHRSANPSGPYSAEHCRTPAETGTVRWACPPDRVQQLRREARQMVAWARRYVSAQSCSSANPSGCEALIRRMFNDRGLSGSEAVAVARCESGLDPRASNGGRYLGLFQQAASYWAGRAAAYGYGGRSAFDPVANTGVSASMVAESGWSHWECSP